MKNNPYVTTRRSSPTTYSGMWPGPLSVSGNFTINGNLTVTGSSSSGSVSYTSIAVSGNATIGGTLGVTGATTLAAVSATTGAFSGVVTSTVSTGTAPFTIASTTKVSNLNADLLDGSDWASPAAIGSGTPAAGSFTTIGASGVITSTVSTGTAPFTVASTTVVSNLNVSQLLGATWAAPGTIGSGTPSTGAFTTISASGQITSTVTTGTAPLVIASTTAVSNLNASLLLGGTWAIPGTIGSTTPSSGAFTTITASSTCQVTGTLSANTITVLSGTTATVYDTTATTVNAFGVATTINIAASAAGASTCTLFAGAAGAGSFRVGDGSVTQTREIRLSIANNAGNQAQLSYFYGGARKYLIYMTGGTDVLNIYSDTATNTIMTFAPTNIGVGAASTNTFTMTSRLLVRSVTDAGPMTSTAGTQREIVFNTSDSKFYGCVTTGSPASWSALN